MKAIRSIIALMLTSAALAAGAAPKGAKAAKSDKVIPEVRYELSGGAGHYNYAPSFIQDKYGIIYGYMCQNRDPFQIIDYIYLYKGIPTQQGYVWQPGTEVVEPSRTGWDDCHICDPDVRRFSVTTEKGRSYKWIMTYLGVDQWDCNHNQIGLAVSDNIEGPWFKCNDHPVIVNPSTVNPIVPYEGRDKWGTGQSTSIVLNDSTIALVYHSTTDRGPVALRMINLSDLSRIDIGEEYSTPFVWGNTYVAVTADRIYAVSEQRSDKYEHTTPTWVGDLCVVRCKERSADFVADMTAPLDTWTEVSRVTPEVSHFPRNHNPGFLTDELGWIPDEDNLMVYFTVSVLGDDWLWSYDMYSARFPIADFLKAHFKK